MEDCLKSNCNKKQIVKLTKNKFPKLLINRNCRGQRQKIQHND